MGNANFTGLGREPKPKPMPRPRPEPVRLPQVYRPPQPNLVQTTQRYYPEITSYSLYREELMKKRIRAEDLEQFNTRITRNADQLTIKNSDELIHKINLDRIKVTSKSYIDRPSFRPTPTKNSFLNNFKNFPIFKANDQKYFPIKPKRPELTLKEERQIKEALEGRPQDQVLADIEGVQLLRKDIQTLKGLNWLNDEVVNAYMSLLVIRGRKCGYKKVYAFNTFFYPKLRDSGYTSIRRWTRKVDIFTHDFILVPVHLGNHWCLAFINFTNKTISYYDSLGGHSSGCCDRLLHYLKEESTDKKKQDFDGESWRLIEAFVSFKIPKQENCSDCGVFACTYAEYLTRQAKFEFSQEDMPYFRNKMVYELITKEILE